VLSAPRDLRHDPALLMNDPAEDLAC